MRRNYFIDDIEEMKKRNQEWIRHSVERKKLLKEELIAKKSELECLIKNKFYGNINYFEEIIQKEIYVDVILTLNKLLNTLDNVESKNLKTLILERIAKDHEINLIEAEFILDLLSLLFVSASKTSAELRMDIISWTLSPEISWVKDTNNHTCSAKNGHITALNLSHDNLKELPESIGLLSELEYLCVMGNGLTTLPLSFNLLTNLKELELSCNKLEYLPDSVYNIAKNYYAKKYIREGVKISEAPVLGLLEILKAREIENYANLENIENDTNILDFYQFYLYKINEHGNIIGIYIREFETIKISYFPEQICSLKKLKELVLSCCDINKIPKEIGNLRALEYLDLSENNIKEIPPEIMKLKSLRYLNLKENNIRDLSLEIMKFFKNLEVISSNIKKIC